MEPRFPLIKLDGKRDWWLVDIVNAIHVRIHNGVANNDDNRNDNYDDGDVNIW